MTRIALLALASVLTLGACAGDAAGKRSHTPRTEVVVKRAKKTPPRADYRARPEDASRTGSGGAER